MECSLGWYCASTNVSAVKPAPDCVETPGASIAFRGGRLHCYPSNIAEIRQPNLGKMARLLVFTEAPIGHNLVRTWLAFLHTGTENEEDTLFGFGDRGWFINDFR